ncbi:MAG: glycoside hydrolase domain-containing protein, partial [Bacteroidales bacterium]
LKVSASAEFDGFMDYKLQLTAKQAVDIKDIRLEIPMTKDKSKYMMGMGKTGGFRPDEWNWKWDVENKSQDAVWLGGVNGGLRIKLKDDTYHRQLVNIYYEFDPLNLPKSWGNGTSGGCDVLGTDNGALIKAYSGERSMKKGESLHFDFELLLTPVKLINRDIQYGDRYYHSNSDVSASYIPNAEKSGANIINVHHKKDINPFINYPYLAENVPALTNFVESAHAKNIRTKVYYTTRELTVNAPEIWAMRSLNGEVIFPGPGKDAKTVVNKEGPHPWLIENFKEDFIPAWKCTFKDGPYKGRQDLSVITVPDSRLNNFYLEGLYWMCKNMKIDGIYIDDSALDRLTLKRARKILDRNRPDARIDMHTWNHFNGMAGYACCLNLYMDLLPYYDQLWIGEGRDYDTSTDYWLIEISGVPFGLTSQLLNHGGNRWRGMVFGITNRLGWYGPTPEYIWNFWDTYKIQDMDMIGFWDADCPAKSDNKEIVATVYKGKNSSIIAVANWTKEEQSGKLQIDWEKLGMNPDKVSIKIPYVKEYQEAKDFNLDDTLNIEGGKGYLLVVEMK